jgi:hypothetical protein
VLPAHYKDMLPRQYRSLVKGVLTRVPVIRERYGSRGTGGTDSAAYCYSVFLRHLVLTRQVHSWDVPVPRRVAEIGPGDSIGVGLAALVAGAEEYVGLDVVNHAHLERNLAVFDGVVGLFAQRAPIPEFTETRPKLASYEFPHDLLPDSWLAHAMAPERLRAIREAITNPSPIIRYTVPWDSPRAIEDGTIDLLWSQAALEHVNDLQLTYDAIDRWLAPSGISSNQIDFRSHGLHDRWNGHWAFSPSRWRIVVGDRPFLLNRAQCSEHLALINQRFRVLRFDRTEDRTGLPREQLQPPFNRDEADAVTSGAFVQMVRKH